MNVKRHQKVDEAVRRMEIMNVFPPMLDLFVKEDVMFRSEHPYGLFIEMDSEEKEEIRKFEEEHNALVYMVLRTETAVSTIDALLFVSDNMQEWYMDIEDLENETAYAYVINHEIPVFSGFGQVGWKRTEYGGIIRTA